MGKFIDNKDFVNFKRAMPIDEFVVDKFLNPDAPELTPWSNTQLAPNEDERNWTKEKATKKANAPKKSTLPMEPKASVADSAYDSKPTTDIKDGVDVATDIPKEVDTTKPADPQTPEAQPAQTAEEQPKRGETNADVPACGVEVKKKVESNGNGQMTGKWTNYVEGMGLLVPNAKGTEQIRRLAELEQNGMYKEAMTEATRLKAEAQKAQAQNKSLGGQLAQQREYQKYIQQRDQLIKQRDNGQWTGHDAEWNKQMDNIENAIRQYAGALGFANGADPITLLQSRSPQAGKFTQEQRSEIVNAKRQNAVYKDVFDTLQGLSPEEWTEAQNQGYLSAVFDKMAEASVSGYFGTDKGAIADAEKIRMQFEVATPEDQEKLNQSLANFIKLNTSFQKAGANPNLTESTKRSLQDGMRAADAGRGVEALDILIRGNLLGDPNVPMDIGSAVGSLKNSYDAYMERFMQTGNVDRNTVIKLAMGNISKNNAIINQFAEDYGRDAHGTVDLPQYKGLDKMASWGQYKTGRQSQINTWNGAGYSEPRSADIKGHKPQAHHEENVPKAVRKRY